MNDKERVLMNIAVDTAGSVFDTMQPVSGGWKIRYRFDNPAAQFVPETLAEKLGMPMKPGDIVRCQTNPNHAWGISELVEVKGNSDFLLREIGGAKLLKMGNEMLDVLRFMSPSRIYTGAKHKIYQWVTAKAFSERYNPDADYYKRCGGVEFDGNKLFVWSRSHIFAAEKTGENGTKLFAQPRKFEITWNDKTKLKNIVAAMREQGFALEFEYAPNEPTEGNAGAVKLTRRDIVRALDSAGISLTPGDGKAGT